MFDKLKQKLYNIWEDIKAWFKNSETVFLARLTAFSGIITTFVGQMDWSPLWSYLQTGTDFSWKQVTGIGISMIGAGILLEIARRRNADL